MLEVEYLVDNHETQHRTIPERWWHGQCSIQQPALDTQQNSGYNRSPAAVQGTLWSSCEMSGWAAGRHTEKVRMRGEPGGGESQNEEESRGVYRKREGTWLETWPGASRLSPSNRVVIRMPQQDASRETNRPR